MSEDEIILLEMDYVQDWQKSGTFLNTKTWTGKNVLYSEMVLHRSGQGRAQIHYFKVNYFKVKSEIVLISIIKLKN